MADREAQITNDRPAAARLLVRAAEIRIERGEQDRAIALLERALELYPDHEPAATRLRELRLARHEVDVLLTTLTQAAAAAAQRERSVQLWILAAELYADMRNALPAALAALQRASAILPSHVGALLKLGEYYARDRQWQRFMIGAHAMPDGVSEIAHHREDRDGGDNPARHGPGITNPRRQHPRAEQNRGDARDDQPARQPR